jgi:hypothetical protein
MTAGFYLNVVAWRRGDEVRRLKRQLEILDREHKANQYINSDYARLRLKQIADDRRATDAQIAELESLTDEQLIERFNPVQKQPDVEGIPAGDQLARGGHVPQQVVVSRTPPLVASPGCPPHLASPAA